jgi:dethiobiotin synthetase
MKNLNDYKGVFITGTDTEVGKTYIGSQIVALLNDRKIHVVPRKPIESGCKLIDRELQADDANKYFEAVQKKVPLAEICPFRFERAISPQRAARLVNKPVTTKEVHQACMKNVSENNFLVIEGAGGFYSPLCDDGLNADLAKMLQLPVLLIANDQLGCINHVLLTVEAIKQNGLQLLAVILNNKDNTHDEEMGNSEDLKTYLDVPIFSVTKDKELKQDSEIVSFISKFFHEI